MKGPTRSSVPRRSASLERTGQSGRLVRALLLLMAAVIAVDAIVGERGFVAMRRARRQHEELATAIGRQRAENARLREEARRLREDPATIEEVARRELGLIRPGEMVFILKDPPQPTER